MVNSAFALEHLRSLDPLLDRIITSSLNGTSYALCHLVLAIVQIGGELVESPAHIEALESLKITPALGSLF